MPASNTVSVCFPPRSTVLGGVIVIFNHHGKIFNLVSILYGYQGITL